MAKRPAIQIYFENENQLKMYKKVVRLSKKTGMSHSRIGYLSLLYGLPHVAESVTGIYLDAQVNNEILEKEKAPYKVV